MDVRTEMPLQASSLLGELAVHDFGLASGVPCSALSPLMNEVQACSTFRYLAAANEGDAVAIASGAQLGGTRAIALFQNSGLGNAVNPLVSLNQTFSIPILLFISWRGEPGLSDEPQHQLMGRATSKLLESLEIPQAVLPTELGAMKNALQVAVDHMKRGGKPYALVVPRKALVSSESASAPDTGQMLASLSDGSFPAGSHSRLVILRHLLPELPSTTAIVATTGFTGRELYSCGDREQNLYMVGSMGCASSLGLGIAVTQTKRRVVVLDGDAALAMRLGNLATIGKEGPDNLIHIVFDNGVNESTGGQPSPSEGINFASLAVGCGYRNGIVVAEPADLIEAVSLEGPVLIQVRVKIEQFSRPRPAIHPSEVARRFREFLNR